MFGILPKAKYKKIRTMRETIKTILSKRSIQVIECLIHLNEWSILIKDSISNILLISIVTIVRFKIYGQQNTLRQNNLKTFSLRK